MREALGVSRSGFHAWLTRSPSQRARGDEVIGARAGPSHVDSDRAYGARRVSHDLITEDISCSLHRFEWLIQAHGLRARPRRRGLIKGQGGRSIIARNVLDSQFTADRPNQKWALTSRLSGLLKDCSTLPPFLTYFNAGSRAGR